MIRPNLRRLAVPTAVLVALAAGVTALAHTSTIDTPVTVPGQLDGNVVIDCSNNPGPNVTLSGNLVMGQIDVVAIFRNNDKGTHERTEVLATSSATILPAGYTITIPKQPVLGGTGGNPFIWVQYLDGDGDALTGEIYLGRCVQGLNTFGLLQGMGAPGTANLVADVDCENNPGPFITFGGDMTLAGLKARFIFRNNDNPVGGPHKAEAVVDVTMVAKGTTIKFPKQPSLGGVGGNPWIWVQLRDAYGNGLTEEILLGRCVQGSKEQWEDR